jgi:hypothetical protein
MPVGEYHVGLFSNQIHTNCQTQQLSGFVCDKKPGGREKIFLTDAPARGGLIWHRRPQSVHRGGGRAWQWPSQGRDAPTPGGSRCRGHSNTCQQFQFHVAIFYFGFAFWFLLFAFSICIVPNFIHFFN